MPTCTNSKTGEYFISGYTGFCPDLVEHVGCNYQSATRDAIKDHRHLETRLMPKTYAEQRIKDFHKNQAGDQFCCPEDRMQRQDAYIAENRRSFRKSEMGKDSDRVTPAFPLTCSEFGSPCVSKHCNEAYTPCLKRYSLEKHVIVPVFPIVRSKVSSRKEGICDACFMEDTTCEDKKRKTLQSSNKKYKDSKACLDSYAISGPCYNQKCKVSDTPSTVLCIKTCCQPFAGICPCGDNKSKADEYSNRKYKYAKPCCSACAGERPRRSKISNYSYKNIKDSKTCCNSCAKCKGCLCRGKKGNTSLYEKSKRLGSQNLNYREDGVIPNYMGFIPGLQCSFGEPYGIAVDRLLTVHFDEISKKRS